MTQVAQNPLPAHNLANKLLRAKDLPQFFAQVYEDPLDFPTRFEIVGHVYYWSDLKKKEAPSARAIKEPAQVAPGAE